jgi:peptide-methionine (S)-S-oxide reductase
MKRSVEIGRHGLSVMVWTALVAVLCFAVGIESAGAAEQAIGGTQAGVAQAQQLRSAIFAGGCFWCVEEAFDKVKGVVETTSGYTGGTVPNPTYEQVTAGGTAHAEAVLVRYDPKKVTYETLLDVFWHNIDPFDAGGQFCDRGDNYRSAIFYHSDRQKGQAEASKKAVEAKLGKPVVTAIVHAGPFYPAEMYHQNFHETNPWRYKFYKWNCGRADRLEEIWGKPKEP